MGNGAGSVISILFSGKCEDWGIRVPPNTRSNHHRAAVPFASLGK